MTVHPLVTIGIPTYNREALLKRALESVSRQDCPNIEVLIADNCSPGSEVQLVVDSFKHSIPDIKYVRHAENIGAFKNFLSLLDRASGKYFMWLADDDEISPNYVSALAGLLEHNPSASCATGHWVIAVDEPNKNRIFMPTSCFPQQSAFSRVLRFAWKSDDAFFYGLHRIDVLRRASFRGYVWPNKGVSINWAYVFLLDMVLYGPVLLPDDKSVQFINHDYTVRHYGTNDHSSSAVMSYVLRRINVHFLYWRKIGRSLGCLVMPIVVTVSLLSLSREFLSFFGGGAVRRIVRSVHSLLP